MVIFLFRHILPESLIASVPKENLDDRESWFIKTLSDHRPVILYLHGNTASRAVAHRVELYNVLRKMDYHVVAFDYRGKRCKLYVVPIVIIKETCLCNLIYKFN